MGTASIYKVPVLDAAYSKALTCSSLFDGLGLNVCSFKAFFLTTVLDEEALFVMS